MIRLLLLAALVAAAGCGEPAAPETSTGRKEALPPADYSQNLQRFYDEDAAVLRIALDHLLTLDEFRRYPLRSSTKKVVVWNATNGSSGFVAPGQVSSELRGRDAPSGLLEELQSRNHGAIPLKNFNPGGRFLVEPPMETSRKERPVDPFEEKYPDAGAYVGFWLPAYTSDGLKSLVRCSFGPTAHGACGTFLLEKKKDGWAVVWSKLSYYA